MQLTHSTTRGDLDIGDAIEVLDALDSFLTRRAICGHEPTGLHAVFKRLWQDCEGDVTAERVRSEIASHKTVAVPTDVDVRRAILERPAYGSSITKYVLFQHNESLGGDKAPQDFWIEHVLPNTYSASWSAFTLKEHEESKDLLANLIPLSSEMNSSLGNASYADKRARYAKDSSFKSARLFAETYEVWNPESLAQRGTALADWAVTRWKS